MTVWSNALNTAALAPIPSASTATTLRVKPGALRKRRTAKRRSVAGLSKCPLDGSRRRTVDRRGQGLQAAALDVEPANGYVVLLGFRLRWRAQPFETSRVTFNGPMCVR